MNGPFDREHRPHFWRCKCGARAGEGLVESDLTIERPKNEGEMRWIEHSPNGCVEMTKTLTTKVNL